MPVKGLGPVALRPSISTGLPISWWSHVLLFQFFTAKNHSFGGQAALPPWGLGPIALRPGISTGLPIRQMVTLVANCSIPYLRDIVTFFILCLGLQLGYFLLTGLSPCPLT